VLAEHGTVAEYTQQQPVLIPTEARIHTDMPPPDVDNDLATRCPITLLQCGLDRRFVVHKSLIGAIGCGTSTGSRDGLQDGLAARCQVR